MGRALLDLADGRDGPRYCVIHDASTSEERIGTTYEAIKTPIASLVTADLLRIAELAHGRPW
jgi:hypothetical protein